MAAFAQIKALLGLDTKGFTAGMNQAQRKMQSFQSVVSRVGGALGVAFSVSMVTRFARSITQLGSSITDLAAQTGLSTDAVQALDLAALRAGVDVDQIRTAFSRLAVTMGQARRGMGTYVELFKTIGLNVNNIKTTEEAFEGVARAIANNAPGTKEFGAALELIGTRSGAKLVEVLQEVDKKGLQRLIADGKELGQIMENDVLKRFDDIEDRIAILKREAAAKTGTNFLDPLLTGGLGLATAANALRKGQNPARAIMLDEMRRLGINFGFDDRSRPPASGDDEDPFVSPYRRGRNRRVSARQQVTAGRQLQSLLAQSMLDSDALSKITGPNARVSQLESIGGQTGINRGMLPVAQRQLKVLEEIKRTETHRDQRDERILDALFTIQAGISQTMGGLL